MHGTRRGTRWGLLVWGTLALGTLLARPAAADGLFHQLPEDGTWAKYSLQLTIKSDGAERAGTGSITLMSVGQNQHQGIDCRWIEMQLRFQVDDELQVQTTKLLLPEADLKAGQNPFKNLARGYYRTGTSDPVAVTTVNRLEMAGLRAFICGPLTDVKELPAQLEVTSLGALECKGTRGTIDLLPSILDGLDNKNATHVLHETRLHEKSPFGVVSDFVEIEIRRGDQPAVSVQAQLRIIDTGRNAESALPDSR